MNRNINLAIFGLVAVTYYFILNPFSKELVFYTAGICFVIAGIWGRLAGIIIVKVPIDDKYEKATNIVVILIGILYTIFIWAFYKNPF